MVIGLSCLGALSSWRLGLALSCVVGFLQDPIRKLVAGQPGWLTLAFIPVSICTLLAFAFSRRTASQTPQLPRTLRHAFLLAATLVLISGLTATIHGSTVKGLLLTLLGSVAPLCLGTGIFFGYSVSSTTQHQYRWLKFWLIVVSILLLGHILEQIFHDPQPLVIGPLLPKRPWLHSIDDQFIRMTSGFFRSPENASWFAATATCLAVGLYTQNPSSKRNAGVWLILGVWTATCCLLGARRKMQVMALIGLSFPWLWYLVRQIDWSATTRWISLGLWTAPEGGTKHVDTRFAVAPWIVKHAIGTAVVLMATAAIAGVPQQTRTYVAFSITSLADLPHRLGYAAGPELRRSLDSASFLGHGIGSMTPGVQHLGYRPHVYIEGGLHRVAIEGGVVGLIGFVTVAAMLAALACAALWKCPRNSERERLAAVLFGCSFSHVACFVIGHQVFGDPYILFTTGLFFGMGVACSRLEETTRTPPAQADA